MDILSRRIRDLRSDSDLKQGEMGTALGITQNMVSNYENGREPPLETILLYAKHFDVSIDYLLGLTNEKKPSSNSVTAAFATLEKLAGQPALTATDLVALLDAAIKYYRKGAPCGDSPLLALRGFTDGLRDALIAAASGDGPALIDGANAAAVAALEVTKMPAALYESQKGDTAP